MARTLLIANFSYTRYIANFFMISRYTLPEMGKIWELNNKYQKWLDIEILACEAYSKKGEIPKKALDNIKKKAKFNVGEIDEIEKKVKHDVISFLTNVADYVGEDSRYIHYGMTSSDIIDTGFSLQMVDALDLILVKLDKFINVLKEKALQYKMTPTIGRTHGIHGEPTTLGLKFLSFYAEMTRNYDRLANAREVNAVGMISGAVGTYANLGLEVEEYICKKLNLKPEPVSTQVIPRDRHAVVFLRLALLASSIERIAIEIRHMQRTEVGEAEEFFTQGQKGSSAMPHKRNPISSENLCGLARLVRSYSIVSLENIPLWHERDISHSSVERVIGPDATILVDYMLARATDLVKNLIVYPDQLKKNLERHHGLIFSGTLLLELAKKGLTREKSYELVQKVAMDCFKNQTDFKTEILKDKTISSYLTKKEIETCFNLNHHLKNVDAIFKRALKK